MVSKKGRGLLMVYTDVAPEHEDEFNRWYNEEHIPERLSIPGVLNAARYTADQGEPRHLACYELSEPDAWYSDAWQYWLNNPTEWSQRMSPSVVGTTYIRNLYRLIYPGEVDEETAQSSMAPVLLVGRMFVPQRWRPSSMRPTIRNAFLCATTCPATSVAAGSRQ